MRIDPKYFNTFLIIAAVVAAIIIVWGTFSYRSNQRELFSQRIGQTDSLAYIAFPRFFGEDSLRILEFEGSYVLLDLWAGWSDPSIVSHKHLEQLRRDVSDTLRVIAASVRENPESVREYRRRTGYPFTFVDGTGFFNRMDVPGIPTQLLFDPEGRVLGTFLGYTDSTRYDSLRSMIQPK